MNVRSTRGDGHLWLVQREAHDCWTAAVSCTAARHLCIAWVSECSSLVVQGDGEQDWQWFCSLFVPASRQRAIYSKIPHDRRVLNFRLLFLLHCACHVDLSLVRVEGVLELDALGVQEEALSARASIFSISDNRSAQSRCAVNPQLVLAALFDRSTRSTIVRAGFPSIGSVISRGRSRKTASAVSLDCISAS